MSLFIGTEEQGGQQYKKGWGQLSGGIVAVRLGARLSASGDLLQVMDALLVNQTDVEGGKVEDEAPVQLEEEEARRGRRI